MELTNLDKTKIYIYLYKLYYIKYFVFNLFNT